MHTLTKRYKQLMNTLTHVSPRWWLAIGALVIGAILVTLLMPKDSPATPAHTTPGSKQEITKPMELIEDAYVHMAGSELQDDGLRIMPVPFAIVNQDGSGGQPNHPVNVYGAHLVGAGSFQLKAKLRGIQNKASLAFYGEVPIIYDEFRYERSTIAFTFDQNKLTINRWLDSRQTAVSSTHTIKNSTSHDLTFTRDGDKLLLDVDGKRIATLPENSQFRSGNLWFGASAENNAWTLTSLVASKYGDDKLEVANTQNATITAKYSNGLQQAQNTKRKDFTIGAAAALAPLMSDTGYANVLLGNFGGITTENAMKWQFIHPALDTYDFKEADALVSVALRHNLKVHGHPLVFGEANPRWVQNLATSSAGDKQRVQAIMLEHVRTVAGRYANKVSSWDVVNEPLADYDDFESGRYLRGSVWLRAMGESYIAKAFTAARQADPKATLFINEFGLEEDGERWDYFFNLVKRLKAQGAPIDGVGFQAHVYERRDKINTEVLKRHMSDLAAIGLVSRISENDTYSDDGQQAQASQYAAVLKACLETPSCTSYTTWGVSDRYDMFRDDDNSLQYGEDFLWDRDMQPTPAVDAMRTVITSQ